MAFLRVTQQQFSNSVLRSSNQLNQNLLKLQRQISTGIKLEKPSDSPSDMATVLPSKAVIKRLDTDIENVVIARSKLNQSVTQLLSAKEAFTRAKSLALDGVQSLEKDTIAREIDGIIDLMMQIANTHDGINPIFSGTSVDPPFEVVEFDSNGNIKSVSYLGEDQRSQIAIGKDSSVDVFYSGSEVFQPKDRGTTVFVGPTGATSGLGADTATGFGKLTVRHTQTVFSGGSGLAVGSSSVDGDTIIGTHELTIDAANGTISLDGGGQFAFDGSETDLQVVGPDGSEVYIDTSGFNGFGGTIQITGEGTLSLDDGASETAIDFSENQVVTNSANGQTTNVNSSNIMRSGVDHLDYVGTADAFQALIDLRDELMNTRDLSGAEWQEAMQRRIADVQRVHDHLLTLVSDQSVSLQNLDSIQERSESYQVDMSQIVEELEATDIVAAITQLQTDQNLLQYTYAASAQLLNGTNLLDYLR